MQYKCLITVKGKGFLGNVFPKYLKGQVIRVEQYNSLPESDKSFFEEDYSDESNADQIERNRKKDEEADNL